MATVQGLAQAKATPTSVSSNPSLTFTNSVAKGDLLVAAFAYQSAALGVPVVTDTQSNVWTQVGQITSILSGSLVTLVLFWALASASGACTVSGSTSGIPTPSAIWMAVAEFTGANSLALISGSTLGFGVNPPIEGPESAIIQATNPPLTTPQGSLLVVAATTKNGTATWSVDAQNNWYSIAVQAGGIVLAFSPNMYSAAPFCDQQAPRPILDRTGDSSEQWAILTAPFTTTILPPTFPLTNANEDTPQPYFQFPAYPYENNTQ
jgi:hypothetical protein